MYHRYLWYINFTALCHHYDLCLVHLPNDCCVLGKLSYLEFYVSYTL